MKKLYSILFLCFITATFAGAFNIEAVDKITIKSSRSGWGYTQSKLIINTVNNTLCINNQTASSEFMELLIHFLSVIEDPAFSAIELQNFGIDQDWLNTNAAIWADDKSRWDENQKELFINTVCNMQTTYRLLSEQYLPDRIHWTDDYPYFQIQIFFKNGETITIQSESQLPFMLPWYISHSGKTAQTYNAQISTAVSALLPEDFPNKKRVSGLDIISFIAQGTEWIIKDELSMLGTRGKIGDTISQIEEIFFLKKSAFRHLGSIDLNTESVWDAELIPKGTFENLFVGLDIAYENETLGSLLPFYSKIDGLIARVLDTPWLIKIIDNSENTIEIRFVNDKSMSNYVQGKFIDDLVEHGKTDLVNEVRSQLDEACFLVIMEPGRKYSRCILLPDGRTILWHFIGDTVLFWNASEFQTWEWYGHQGTAAVISPSGKILD
ncbi:hypothetical protein [Breznakiella homolactica]|uniref:Uncharacterized protein n=1 Tax=Breznakiella homolactica TaxID=2798577 RepID=A0A7T8B9V1_9SPIR|nr:hypothetical protein [Breznakiella homolactica]QQO09994.1 hypothetical protein JFL75_03510 [Breznakiella homolactica]